MVTFLELIVSDIDIVLLADKVTEVKDYTEPHSCQHLRQFADLVSFHRFFTPNCVKIAAPLTDPLQEAKRTFAFPEATKQTSTFVKDAITKIALLT